MFGFLSILLLSCVAQKKTADLSKDKRSLFPIGEQGKWGFVDVRASVVIEPKYEEVNFFYKGLAVVKLDGKYGYIRKNGERYIKLKYLEAGSFISDCARVKTSRGIFFIDIKGNKIDGDEKTCPLASPYNRGCTPVSPKNPMRVVLIRNGKYEIPYKYHLKADSSISKTIIDTTQMGIDSVYQFSHECILLKKDGQYGLLNIWNPYRNIIKVDENSDEQQIRDSLMFNLVDFKYDTIIYEHTRNYEVTSAKVMIGDKWGVINRRGEEVIEVNCNSIQFKPHLEAALIEFESGRFGYKFFSGKEVFIRMK